MTKGILLFSMLCGPAVAQHDHSMAMPAEKPVTLLAGLGIWTHPIGTRSAEAQKYFDQGLVLLYGFNRPEALRSFRKVLELDPKAAMAQWGIAMALGPYVNMDIDPDVHIPESCAAVDAGLKMNPAATDQAWLEAAAARCPDFPDPGKYAGAMRALAARYPDDPDAQTLYAEAIMLTARWHWYGSDGKPAEGIPEAERVLEGVLRRYPDHPGANHFYIHIVESSPTPERAVPSAQKLMGITPAAGHMVHMPGHIWLVLGEYATTVDVNERAAQVDREYFARTGMMSTYYMYYLHNLQFILYARSMQGRAADTVKAAATMREAGKPLAQAMPDMADLPGVLVTTALLRVNRWDHLIAEPEPKASPLGLAFWRYARAMSFAMKGRTAEARTEQGEFEAVRKKLDPNMPWDTAKIGEVMEMASEALAARLEEKGPEAITRWRRAVEMQDRLPYDEPPLWYYPLRESLGASLMLAGDATGAEAVFREGLRRSPKNGRMLFGLLESLKAQGKSEAAAWVEREYRTAWKGSDVVLRMAEM